MDLSMDKEWNISAMVIFIKDNMLMVYQKVMVNIHGPTIQIIKVSLNKDSDMDLDVGKKIIHKTVSPIEAII